MDEFDYPGIRIYTEGFLEKLKQPIKIDVSTDDVITPEAIEYKYPLLFEERVNKERCICYARYTRG